MKSIQLKILIISGLCMIITSLSLLTFSTIFSLNKEIYILTIAKEFVEVEAQAKLKEIAKAESYMIKSSIEKALDSSRVISQFLSTVKDNRFGNADKLSRKNVNDMLFKVLEGNSDFLGIYTLWETNAFDGLDSVYASKTDNNNTGRFNLYLNRNEEGKIASENLTDYENTKKYDSGVRYGDYYLLPKERSKECIIDPFPYEVQGNKTWLTSLVSPIIVDNKFYGIAGIDIKLSFLQNIVEEVNKGIYEGKGFIAIISNNGTIAAMSGSEKFIGKHIKEINPEDWEEELEAIQNGENLFVNEEDEMELYIPITFGETNTPWSILIKVPINTIMAAAGDLRSNMEKMTVDSLIILVVISTIVILAGLVILFLLVRSIVNPIKKATDKVIDISKGIIKKENLKIKSKDEIGRLSNALNEMNEFLVERNELMERIAKGNINLKVKLASKDDEVGKSLEHMVFSLNNIISQIDSSVEQIASGSNQISESSQALSLGSSKQAASLEEITASINEIASQVQQNVENSRKTDDFAKETKEISDNGNKQMKELVSAMEKVNKSAEDIKNIVKVIDDIAFQTNLLALNADIEAARVGKYGRGFAVVANSVRNLATKSGLSVKETTAMIEEVVRNIKKGNELVKLTAEQFEKITESSINLSSIANEVAEASQEQAHSIELVSTGLEQIEEVVQSNSANAEENAASSEELASQTKILKELVSYFTFAKKDLISEGEYKKSIVPFKEKNVL